MKKLDSYAIKAGVFLLLNALLWFPQVCADYLIQDAGFWGAGGMLQYLFTDQLANITNVIFLVVFLFAAIMMFTRNRIAAMIGLFALAGYYAYALVNNLSGGFVSWIDIALLIAAIVFAAIAVAQADNDTNAIRLVAILFIALWLIAHVAVRIATGFYGNFASIVVTIIYVLRYLLLALALLNAATVSTEKAV